jgi:hypothetical protein
MPIVNCIQCKKEFYVKPFWIKKGKGKYCSLNCKYLGSRKGSYVKCSICQKEVYRKQNKYEHSKSGKFFCGKSCQTKWRNQEFIGPKHANWKNGRYSYRSVLGRNKIVQMCILCKATDKRILSIHHIDQNRLNNKVSNLAWLCYNCHFLVHHDSLERTKFLLELAKR